MRTARGYIPDPADHKVTAFAHARKLGATQLPDAVDLRPFAPRVLDQNSCGSCVGHSVACAIATALARAGTPLTFIPSPRSVYQLARCIDRYDLSQQLADEGSMPNQAVRSLSEWGVRPMKTPSPLGYDSDCDLSNVNDEPLLGELEQDAQTLLVGQYEITSDGAERAADVCAAIAQGFPVTIAVAGGANAFQEWTPSAGPLDAHGPLTLDHYVWLIGYSTDAHGKRVFRARNSWGASYGDDGDVLITEGYLSFCSDIYPFSVRKAAS